MYNSYSALNLLGGMLYTVILLVVAYFVLKIVANWEIFEKAGQPSSRSTATTSNSTFTGATAGCF